MMNRKILFSAILMLGSVAVAQVSIEEAEQNLKHKLSTRPSATQPVSEVEKLRQDNLRLRERIMDLQEEVATLKAALGRASAPATTHPAIGMDDAALKLLLGRWRGGEIAGGDSYTIEFAADSTYKQIFLFNPQRDAGQYRLMGDGIMQMWSEKAPEDKKHNEYKIVVTPGLLTLTPTVMNGVDVKSAKALVLQRAG